MTPEQLAHELTDILRLPAGTMTLRQLQARCLLGAQDAADVHPGVPALFTNAAVGLGKSLLFALLMTVIGGSRPVICTRAAAVGQLRDDIERYRCHWKIPNLYRLLSYETVSTHPNLLHEIKPTFLGLDEGHLVKSPLDPKARSGRRKRFGRFRADFPNVPWAIASGSPGDDFEGYAHLLVWAVPALADVHGGPIPTLTDGEHAGTPGGPAFRELCRELEDPANEPRRRAFWERVRATPGVVISDETFLDKPLKITHHFLPTDPAMEPHWRLLRERAIAPDDWQLDGMEVWGFARVLGTGLFHEHDPRPPQAYRDARKAWHSTARDVIDMGARARGGPYDTEGQVAAAAMAGTLPGVGQVYQEWLRVKPTYTPVTRPVWLTQKVLEDCAEWGEARRPLATTKEGGSIIWVRNTWTGEALSKMTGWPYYGDKARNARGEHVRHATAPVIIVSVNSCAESHNLQRYSRNRFVNPWSKCWMAEQSIGRTHRSNQHAEQVEVELLYTCLEDYLAAQKAERAAEEQEYEMTAPRKLTLAQHERAEYPTDGGAAWARESNRVVVEIPDE